VRCDDVAVALSESLDGSTPLPRSAGRHVDRCLRCQAEQAQYRRVMRMMRTLKPQIIEPAPGLLVEILVGIESDAGPRAIRSILERHRVAYVAAATAATAATAAGAIVIAARTRRPASA